MRKYILLTALVALLAPVAAQAQLRRSAGVQDLIFFGKNGPVRISLQVEIDGQPAALLFYSYVQQWVKFMDRDGDGSLNADEVRNMPNATAMTQMFRSGYYYPYGTRYTMNMKMLGQQDDAKVGVRDLLAYYQRSGITPFQIAPNQVRNQSQNFLSNVLFKKLDTNGDGKVSETELVKGKELIENLDFDDDELLDQTELTNADARTIAYRGLGGSGRVYRPTNSIPDVFYVVKSGKSSAQLTALLLAKYDKNKDAKLSRKESGMKGFTFQRFDLNKNNYLSVTEMILFLHSARPIPVVVRLGNRKTGKAGIEVPGGPRTIANSGARVAKTSQHDLHLLVGTSKVSVHRSDENPAMMRTVAYNYYGNLFRLANPRNKKFLEKSDLSNVRFRLLATIFPIADRNGDDKLTMAELDALSKLTAGARRCYVSIRMSEEGRALYQLLDLNRDNKLSRRELISGWKHLADLDQDGDGALTANEFARQYVVAVNRGMANYTLQNPNNTVYRPVRQGPEWFQRMDTNGDGDVSVREFLGPRRVFEQLDRDNDGLLDAQEAQQTAQLSKK